MNKRNLAYLIIFAVIIAISISYYLHSKYKIVNPKIQQELPQEPIFKKQGSLTFSSNNSKQTLKTIDIEIANDEYSREKGLMYRRTMDETQGMLFIFDNEEPRFFWMKNTYISLDIIYIDKDKQIVSIQKSAIPLSEESLPSNKNTMYVVEVIGGFTDKYLIKEGDKIEF